MSGARGETERYSAARGRLKRDLVVDRAIAFVDDNGLLALSMRRLGRELGVEAMSLYRYVNGRDDLLQAMVDRLVERLRMTDDSGPQDGTWQGYLHWLARTVQTIALKHPNLFPLVISPNPATPWLRPPLRSLEVVEQFLSTMLGHGFSEEQVVVAYQLFTGFVLGHLRVETGSITSPSEVSDDSPDDQSEDDARAPNVPEDKYPALHRLAPALAGDHAEDEFSQALEVLIDRLDQLRSGGR